MKKRVVMLDDMTLRKLLVIGDGNVSAGVRKAAAATYAIAQGLRPSVGSVTTDVEGADD